MSDIEPGAKTQRPLTINEKREIIRYRQAEGTSLGGSRVMERLVPRMSAYLAQGSAIGLDKNAIPIPE